MVEPGSEPQQRQGQGGRLSINSAIEFSERSIGDRLSYVGYDPGQNKYFHFGPVEREAFLLLQEGVAPSELPARLSEFGVSWDEEALSQYIMTLTKWGILRFDCPEPAQPPLMRVPVCESDATSPINAENRAVPVSLGLPNAAPALKVIGALLCPRIPLFSAGALIAPWMPLLGWLYGGLGHLVWLCCVVSSLWLVWNERLQFSNQVAQLMSPHYWPWFAVLWFVIKVVHEAGHAICARRHGVRVGDAGVLLFMGAPMFYVDVTDAWKLKRRRERVMIAMAGVYFELLIASLAVWFWVATDDRVLQYAAAQVILLAGPATLLVNANPLLRLDGYYALSDFTGIPNLRMHGRRILGNYLEHVTLGRALQTSLLDTWRTAFAACHAFCSVIFQVVWMSGLIFGVTYFAGLLGVFLALSAALLWVVLPCITWFVGLRRAADWQSVRPRFIGCTIAVFGLVIFLGTIPSPFARRVPAVVRYRDEDPARAAVDGFVKVVHVKEGERVTDGQLIVELDDPDLRMQRQGLATDLEITTLRIAGLEVTGNAAMAEAEREKAFSIQRQLAELDRQIESLGVRASRDGVICSTGLEDLGGRFVRKGQVIAVIAEEVEKELVTSIAPGDIDAYLHLVKSAGKGNVRLRGGEWIETTLQQPKPRFSDIIPHPALAASHGGPLAIREAQKGESNGELRTNYPRCRGISELTPETAVKVRAGQQGVLFVGDTRSLWERVGDWAMRWMASDEPI